MRSFWKAILALTPVALFSTAPAMAAGESWRQTCSGPAYVCGEAKPAIGLATKKVKPAGIANDEPATTKKPAKKVVTTKAKKPVVAQDDDVPVKPKKKAKLAKAKTKAVVAQDDDAAPAPKKKKAKIASSDTGGSSYQSGMASWYGGQFHGRTTANGEKYNMWDYTAAHKTLPFGTRVKVTNTRNGDTVIVRINDRGPFVGGRVIDLSRAAANDIGMANSGVAPVKLTILGKG